MSKIITQDIFVDRVRNLVGDEYTVLGQYTKTVEKIQMKHNLCDTIFDITPNNFMNGKRCKKCSAVFSVLKRTKTHETFVEEFNSLSNNEYELLGMYVNAYTKILFNHLKCNVPFYMTPSHFLHEGSRCPKCFGNALKNTEQFKQSVYERVGDEYTVLGEYKNNNTKIDILHNKCNNIYNVAPCKFLLGQRCVICNESKGEQRLRKYLENNNIIFRSQYVIKECKNKEPLPFDFAVFNNYNQLQFLIEYDGEYHYIPIKGQSYFKYQKKLDNIKTNYCLENNIGLLRIPYWDYENIETILNNQIKETNNG